MKRAKLKIKLDDMFTLDYMKYTVSEFFVAAGIRWVRCVDKRDDNRYFTEGEVFRILKRNSK